MKENLLITVSAAVITNDQGQLLLVRKKNTDFYMQVGGKLEPNEPPETTIIREIKEEIGVEGSIIKYLGKFHTQAANETGYLLKAYLYEVKILGNPVACAEIEDLVWFDPKQHATVPIAPLTAQYVIPLIK
ncbi:NUDIX hydrolase [Acinetobacter nectaris]|uniref:NUDIX hydrolase n=1 Tax=Acinetobacter nectaris TaxID=1219382 RepID=UPI001F296C41|nr:NUDIX domain-containing protein [Acinetobacter nectaris]MCF9047146.1 NUDIX domain-containing protein [Acinetobacter nectaris]